MKQSKSVSQQMKAIYEDESILVHSLFLHQRWKQVISLIQLIRMIAVLQLVALLGKVTVKIFMSQTSNEETSRVNMLQKTSG